MYCAKSFLEVSVATIESVPVAYDSIAELTICNVNLKLRGLKFKTVTSGGNSRGRGYHM